MHNSKQQTGIPPMAEKLIYLILPKSVRDPVMGDLQEEFNQMALSIIGPLRARWWYRGQVIKSFRYFILKEKGDIMTFLLSIFVFIILSVAAGMLGSRIGNLINIPSLIVVIIPSFIFALAATSVQSWKMCLKLLLVDQDDSQEKEVREISRFLKVLGNMCVVLGVFYTLFGLIQVLSGFDFSQAATNSIFNATSICLLALLYGIGFKGVFYVADQRLQNRFSG